MRDIVFKALTSKTSKKRDICVQEAIEKDGILARTERRCRYFIMNKIHVDNIDEAVKLTEDQFRNTPYRKKHYYILKVHDSEKGEDRFLCKIAGFFYAVYGQEVYCIAYIHSFRIVFTTIPLTERGNEDGI